MEPTDVISLASAKDWLSVDYDDAATNAHITRLIGTAIDYVENYTCHLMYQRPVLVTAMTGYPGENPANNFPPLDTSGWRYGGIRHTPKGTSVYIYPFTVTSVADSAGNPFTNYTTYLNALKTLFYAPYGTVFTLLAGYDNVDTFPPSTLLDACYKMITYLYENRDMYQVSFPTDIQMLVNQYRRAII